VGKDGRLIVYTEISGEFKRKFESKIDNSALYALTWLSASRLAVGGESKIIYLVSITENLEITARLRSHQSRVTGLAFHAGASTDVFGNFGRLISVGADKALKQWLLSEKSGSYLESYFGHTGEVVGVSLLSDSLQSPITCGLDNSCRVWNLEKDSHKVFPGLNSVSNSDCISAIDSKHFISGSSSGELTLWGLSYRKPMTSIQLSTELSGAWITAVAGLRGTDLAGFADNASGGFSLLRVAGASGGGKSKMSMEMWGERIAVEGIVTDANFAASGKLLVLSVGRDHRLGRWIVDEKGKNGVVFVRLDHGVKELQFQ
jgi:ribosomal RNA-processing protein 9